jgi:hypothetical protein
MLSRESVASTWRCQEKFIQSPGHSACSIVLQSPTRLTSLSPLLSYVSQVHNLSLCWGQASLHVWPHSDVNFQLSPPIVIDPKSRVLGLCLVPCVIYYRYSNINRARAQEIEKFPINQISLGKPLFEKGQILQENQLDLSYHHDRFKELY